ncbi:hypothetical protein D3C81_2064980 [compost metagenome]
MFGGGRRQVIAVEVETGAERVFAQTGRRNVAFGADHSGQCLAFCGFGETGDLPANALER